MEARREFDSDFVDHHMGGGVGLEERRFIAVEIKDAGHHGFENERVREGVRGIDMGGEVEVEGGVFACPAEGRLLPTS